ncbi:prestin-like [Scylla paramamosain]|uniref:prestin-like n=1 Tax=Scylla paramamosain TaxID=85552 RepID=UPI003083D6E7
MAARLPILDWLPKYQPRQAFLGDLIAGLTVGVMAVPQGEKTDRMAYAMLAHLPPITGLYAGVISGLVYMLLGTSHHISFGVVGSLGVLTAKAIGNVVTYETVPGSAAAPLSTTLSTTATLAQGLQNFTADGNSTSDHSGYSSVEMVVVLALLTGLCMPRCLRCCSSRVQMLMGVLQLGQVFSVLLSHMIVSAFTTSVAYDILFSQLKSLLGIPLPRYTGAFKSFYVSPSSAVLAALNAVLMSVLSKAGRDMHESHNGVGGAGQEERDGGGGGLALLTANPTVVGVSALCITLLVANNEILKPRLKKVCPVPVPVELVVMVVGTVVSHVLNLEEEQNVTVIGHVPKGFPTPSVPHLELVPQLLAHSFIIAVIGYVSAISMAKIIAKRKGYVIQATQELFAHFSFHVQDILLFDLTFSSLHYVQIQDCFLWQGITNFVGSFFSCAPVSVSLSRSVIQEEVGGVTGLASLFSCSVLMIMLYSIGPLFSALPNCVLSAVILVSFKGLFLQVKDLAKLWSSSRLDAAIWLATFVVSVVVGLDYGLLAGLAASAVVLLLRSQRPPALHLGHVPFTDLYLDLNTYHKAVKVPGVKIFQFGGPLHFGNASYFHSSLFSVTGLDLAAAKPAATTTVPLMDTRQSEVRLKTFFFGLCVHMLYVYL